MQVTIGGGVGCGIHCRRLADEALAVEHYRFVARFGDGKEVGREVFEAFGEQKEVVCRGAVSTGEARWVGESGVSHVEECSLAVHGIDKGADIAEAIIDTGDLVGRDIARLHEEGVKELLHRRRRSAAGGGESGHEFGERGDGELESGLATKEHLAGVGIGDEEGGGGDL